MLNGGGREGGRKNDELENIINQINLKKKNVKKKRFGKDQQIIKGELQNSCSFRHKGEIRALKFGAQIRSREFRRIEGEDIKGRGRR